MPPSDNYPPHHQKTVRRQRKPYLIAPVHNELLALGLTTANRRALAVLVWDSGRFQPGVSTVQESEEPYSEVTSNFSRILRE